MTLIEFLSLDIKQGQKVTLHLKAPHSDATEGIPAFFYGFRNYAYHGVAHGADEIIPVFNKVSSRGKKLRAHLDQSTWLDEIAYIEVQDGNDRPKTAEEASSLLSATENLEQAAQRQVHDILKEMSTLFPGKRILLGPDGYIVQADYYLKYGCDSGYVDSAGWEDGAPAYGLSLSCEHVDRAATGSFRVLWQDMLHSLLQAIEDPIVEDCDKKNFVDTDTMTWKDIPLPDPKTCPVLDACGSLHALRANLWFKGLSDRQKRREFDNQLRHYLRNGGSDDPGKAAAFIDSYWSGLKPKAKWLYVPDGTNEPVAERED